MTALPGYCLCLLAGAYVTASFDELPSTAYLASLAAVAVTCLSRAPLRYCAFFLLGLSLHWFAALQVLGDFLPAELQGKTHRITLVVDAFPQHRGDAMSFTARTVDAGQLPGRIRLSWFDPPAIPAIGESWSLNVRLRRPRGFANPHAFDYEAWLLREKIGATGYVVDDATNRRLEMARMAPFASFRREFVERASAHLPDDDATAVLLAITAGARHRITRSQWERFATGGVTHLMAISGLHIGLAGTMVFVLLRCLGACFLRLRNLRDIAMSGAMLAAAAYAQASGFAVPAQRATLMAAVAIGAVLLRRRPAPATALAAACMLIVVSDPLAVLAPGFQLSFGAVAILLWRGCLFTGREHGPDLGTLRRMRGIACRLPALQLALSLGLFPVVAGLSGRFAWLAVPMNLLALPLFQVVTVPAALAGMILQGPAGAAGDMLLRLAHASIRGLLALLDFLVELPGANLELAAPDGTAVVASVLVASAALLPRCWPGRHLAWIALGAVIVHRPPPPPLGCFDVHVLDVGQGLGMVVQTAGHVAVFDTGPAFRSGADTGQLVIAPFLGNLRVKTLDLLVVSHADQDHAGGVTSLSREFAIRQVLVGEELDNPDLAMTYCEAGQRWQWDGVNFEVIHPVAGRRRGGNDASCVVSIRAGRRHALLTGDIEAITERSLVARGLISPADLVIVPHHGSRTSSSAEFIGAVDATSAVISSGHGNRWHLPRPDVVRRWQASGATVVATAESGAVSQRLCRDGSPSPLQMQRFERRRYWRQ